MIALLEPVIVIIFVFVPFLLTSLNEPYIPSAKFMMSPGDDFLIALERSESFLTLNSIAFILYYEI